MKRLVIISNQLPFNIIEENGTYCLKRRIDGFPTGLKKFYQKHNTVWIGTPGLEKPNLQVSDNKELLSQYNEANCYPVCIDAPELEQAHDNFCNKTIWPLFHYFTQNATYSNDFWRAYKEVNEKFADFVLQKVDKDDTIWVHDYHLMLLPHLLREKQADLSVGFFLHIPFPSFEIFRLLPWRTEILEGLLGADLIGVHTYDYERHLMSCVRRLLGYDSFFNQIRLDERVVKVDAYPMGIDYDFYTNEAKERQQRSVRDKSQLQKEIDKYFLIGEDRKLILSIDRLDPSKGIPDRLRAYEMFLEQHPEFHEKVTLLLLVNPVPENEQSRALKREVDELVGCINGKYGIINWTPVWYFHRTMSRTDLIDMYSSCDIALILPIRDGMNLVAKEYIASKADSKGVLILSEMAGASKEMSEALIVNPNNRDEIAESIHKALIMPEDKQVELNKLLQNRLKRYNQEKWANDFINAIEGVKELQETKLTKKVGPQIHSQILNKYKKAEKRIIFLDYDGTLSPFVKDPQKAKPDAGLYEVLKKLTDDDKNDVVIISGRDKETLGKWFDKKWKITFIAEHGVWMRSKDGEWGMIEQINKDWMEIIYPIMEFYVDRTPRTFIEEKNYSLVWHYRKADPDLGTMRSWELKDELKALVSNLNLEIMDGDKVIEIKSSGINKGRAALQKMGDTKYEFIFGIGDDWTDEYTFEALPDNAITVKVGTKSTKALYYVEDVKDVRKLLKAFGEEDK